MNGKGRAVLVGSMLLTLVLGSVHAFSVFLLPLEETFGVARSEASLSYSIALMSLTVLVLTAHHLFRKFSVSTLALVACIGTATGAIVAGVGEHIAFVWVGYGILFGAANGLGYVLALQFSAHANPGSESLAMGLVTASYGIGAAVAPVPFDLLVERYGFTGGMAGLAAALVVVAPVTSYLYRRSNLGINTSPPHLDIYLEPSTWMTAILWASYGAAVAAGLMVIGHATEIARSVGMTPSSVVWAPIVIAIANVIGCVIGGFLLSKNNLANLLRLAAAVSVTGLISLSLLPTSQLVFPCFAAIGFSYGFTIAIMPAAITLLYGPVGGVRVYGQVFTAWGTAGLLAPWAAGFMFGSYGNYDITLQLAICLGILTILLSRWLPKPRASTIPDTETQ